MHYLQESFERRSDVRHVLPSARTVISLGTVYNTARPYSNEFAGGDRAAIARYAWGDDYHTVLEGRLDRLVESLRAVAGEGFEARRCVDTGPVQERVYAQYAGPGLDRQEHVPDQSRARFLALPVRDHHQSRSHARRAGFDQCGTCTLCLASCPTGALVEPGVLDSTRCLST
jgi:epoxyqueuosine reductase